MISIKTVAVIGAGMAGLTAARALAAAGLAVTIFDKGRRPGGRLATRRADGWVFNHGCQFFTIRDEGFDAATATSRAPWPVAGANRYAGVPDMAAIASHLASGLDVRQSAHVRAVAHHGDAWVLRCDDNVEYHFDALVIAIPAPQAAALLASGHPTIAARLAGVQLSPCWAVMLGYDTPDGAQTITQAARQDDGPIAWLAPENTRPEASAAPAGYTIHATPAWSASHLEDHPDTVITALTQAALLAGKPVYAAAHRWRYALAAEPLGEDCIWDPSQNLGLCGDWCLGGRLEAAYLSGRALARHITA